MASFSCSRHWDKRSGALLRRVIRLSPDLQNLFQIAWEAVEDGWQCQESFSMYSMSPPSYSWVFLSLCMSSSLKPSQKLPVSPECGRQMALLSFLATYLACQDDNSERLLSTNFSRDVNLTIKHKFLNPYIRDLFLWKIMVSTNKHSVAHFISFFFILIEDFGCSVNFTQDFLKLLFMFFLVFFAGIITAYLFLN